MTLGQKLKALLKDNSMTQEDLAERLEVSRQAVGKWVNDKGIPEVGKSLLFGIIFRPNNIKKSKMNTLHLMIRYSGSLKNREKAEERNMQL